MTYRSQCKCECHSRPGMVHIAPCCDPDPLPEGVESVMYLRDGWPRAILCKVKMRDGCVGIGLVRYPYKTPSPAEADAAAFQIAMAHMSSEPPDYTELHEYLAKKQAVAG